MATLILEGLLTCEGKCGTFPTESECKAEARAFRAAARAKHPKPTGYTWRLWHNGAPRVPKPLPKPGTYPAWAWETPRERVASILRNAVVPGEWHTWCLDEFRKGRHPWTRTCPACGRTTQDVRV